MAKLYNLARMATATTGTGTITLGSAVSGHLSFAAAGAANGDTVTYAIEDGLSSEIGRGVYTSSGTTLTRSVLRSTNSNTAINLSGSAQVFITAAAEDLPQNGLGGLRNKIRNPNFAINQRVVSGTVTLLAGAYGHDGWKASGAGCEYTFATSAGVTTLTITSGSLIQVVEGGWGIEESGTYCLSWAGTATARIDGGSYAASGMTASLTGGTDATIEFSTGTLSLVQLERGSFATMFEMRRQVEIDLCQRYFSKSMRLVTAPADGIGYAADAVFGVGGQIAAGTIYAPFVVFPARMRTVPTVTLYRTNLGSTAGRWQYLDNPGNWVDGGSPSLAATSETGFLAQFSGTNITSFGAHAVTGGWKASAEL